MPLGRELIRMRESGVYRLEELMSDTDGSLAYRYQDAAVSSAISGSWEAANVDLDPDIEWTCDDLEDDDLEVSMTVEAYARLVSRARRHCEGCSVECSR